MMGSCISAGMVAMSENGLFAHSHHCSKASFIGMPHLGFGRRGQLRSTQGTCQTVGSWPSQELSMHKDGNQTVETAVEARGGLLGRPVLLILLVSCVLAVAALIVTYSGA
jgi:hypothetical protein